MRPTREKLKVIRQVYKASASSCLRKSSRVVMAPESAKVPLYLTVLPCIPEIVLLTNMSKQDSVSLCRSDDVHIPTKNLETHVPTSSGLLVSTSQPVGRIQELNATLYFLDPLGGLGWGSVAMDLAKYSSSWLCTLTERSPQGLKQSSPTLPYDNTSTPPLLPSKPRATSKSKHDRLCWRLYM